MDKVRPSCVGEPRIKEHTRGGKKDKTRASGTRTGSCVGVK